MSKIIGVNSYSRIYNLAFRYFNHITATKFCDDVAKCVLEGQELSIEKIINRRLSAPSDAFAKELFTFESKYSVDEFVRELTMLKNKHTILGRTVRESGHNLLLFVKVK